MKIWLLKVFGICLCICIIISLFTTYSNGQLPFYPYGYQQSYNPNNFYVSPSPFEDPYRNNPFLEDDYEPPPDFSNWIWTDPWTAYDPSGGGAVAVNWQPEYVGTSPYFQQTGYNPYNLNMPYNYGYQQSYNPYGYQQTYNPYGYQQPFNPYSYQQSYNPYVYQQSFNPYGYQQAYNPYFGGYQQPFNPYGYQQQSFNPYIGYGLYGGLYGGYGSAGYGAILTNRGIFPYTGPDLSNVIWTGPDIGYDPITGGGVSVFLASDL